MRNLILVAGFFSSILGRTSGLPKCGSETFGQGFDPFKSTLHGHVYPQDNTLKKTVFFTIGTFNSSCGELPMCVNEQKSCQVEEHLYATMVDATDASFLSAGISADIEVTTTTGALFWESTSTVSQSYQADIATFEEQDGIVVLQGGYGKTWSGMCNINPELVYYGSSFDGYIRQIANCTSDICTTALADSVMDEFGPTVVVGSDFGGAYTTTYLSTNALYAAYMDVAESGTQGIHDNGYFYGVGGDASSAVKTTDCIYWEKSYSTRHSSSIGMTPELGISYVDTIGDNCVPIRYTVWPLSQLVETLGITDVSYAQTMLVTNSLSDAEYRYCVKTGGLCGEAEPTSAPTSAPAFAGIYEVKDDGSGIKNPYTNGFNCPTSYVVYKVGRTLSPEGKIGQTTFLCMILGYPEDDFGGAYEKEDDSYTNNNLNNPATGNLSCSSGYTSIKYGRAMTAEPTSHQEGANLYYCQKTDLSLAEAYIGGFYQKSDSGTKNSIGNYFTKTTSCPFGFKAYQIARVYTPEGKTGANQFVCLNNV
mmetsp:Transcript_73109/g.143411  ORF Transcript_73109/g.143411 Transcript_73109/m.143411 type:complete len:535 (-) Transcript_73109:114-1718(-)